MEGQKRGGMEVKAKIEKMVLRMCGLDYIYGLII